MVAAQADAGAAAQRAAHRRPAPGCRRRTARWHGSTTNDGCASKASWKLSRPREDPVLNGARIKSGAAYCNLQELRRSARVDGPRCCFVTRKPDRRKACPLLRRAQLRRAAAGRKGGERPTTGFQAKFSGDPVAENLPLVIGLNSSPNDDPARPGASQPVFRRSSPGCIRKSRLRETALLATGRPTLSLARARTPTRSATLDTFLAGQAQARTRRLPPSRRAG